jgi:hypothetical protein
MKTRLLVHGSSLVDIKKHKRKKMVTYVAAEWLVSRPHIVLWANEILISEGDFKSAHLYFEDDICSESIRLLFDILKDRGVIKTFEPSSIVPPFFGKAIERQVKEDEKRWKIQKPADTETGKVDLANIHIGGVDICHYRLKGIYSSLGLARLLDTYCLFDTYEYEVCRRRFGEGLVGNHGFLQNPFERAFDVLSPNIQLLGNYVIHAEQCDTCRHKKQCASNCVEQTEEAVSFALELRYRDEMVELKKVISDSIEKLKKGEINSRSEQNFLKNEIQTRADNCKKRLLNTFPQVERWVNITTAISTPLVFAGALTGNSLVSFVGLGLLGSSQATNEIMKYLQSKYRWVAFLDEISEINPIQRRIGGPSLK